MAVESPVRYWRMRKAYLFLEGIENAREYNPFPGLAHMGSSPEVRKKVHERKKMMEGEFNVGKIMEGVSE